MQAKLQTAALKSVQTISPSTSVPDSIPPSELVSSSCLLLLLLFVVVLDWVVVGLQFLFLSSSASKLEIRSSIPEEKFVLFFLRGEAKA